MKYCFKKCRLKKRWQTVGYMMVIVFSLALLLVSCGRGKRAEESATEESATGSEETVTASTTDEFTDTAGENENPQKRIAFTFDDGPHAEYTKKIADKARELNGNVTFFIVGSRLSDAGNADAFRYVVEAGCEVGIHAYTHTANYDECDDATYHYELSETVNRAKALIADFSPSLMRPVGGRILTERAKNSPYAVIKWNIDTHDWKYKGAETGEEQNENVQKIVDAIVKNADDGAIVLMHDLYENTYLAFCQAAEILTEQGFQLVTVSEILGGQAEAGKIYSSGTLTTGGKS